MLASQDDPLPDTVEEPVHLSEPPGARFGIMLRLVDVQHAIEARPALPQASASGSGAPKIDINPSPTIWLTTPPAPVMASNISV